MNSSGLGVIDVALARVCANCSLCRRARRKQKGFAYTAVRQLETRICPFCRAYERVYGRKSYEAG